MRLKLYLSDFEIATLNLECAYKSLQENPYEKKKILNYEHCKKQYIKKFNMFADELALSLNKTRDKEFDCQIREKFQAIKNLIVSYL